MKHPARFLAPASGCLLALSLALAGCSESPSKAEPEAAANQQDEQDSSSQETVAEDEVSENNESSDAETSAADEADEPDADESSDSEETTASTDDGPVVGKRVVKDKNGELTVELHQPEVSDDGETLDVNFTFSHTPEDQTSTVRTDLSGYRVSSTDYAVNTWIIGGKKRYLPGRNADNDCALHQALDHGSRYDPRRSGPPSPSRTRTRSPSTSRTWWTSRTWS
jgi:hypothetical protein